MSKVEGIATSNVAFGKKFIDLKSVMKSQDELAKLGKNFSAADRDYLNLRLLEEKTRKELPKTGAFLKYMSDHDGEIQNQLLNALFTSTLAPLMIAVNPFVNKTDEEKFKTALRQPVSAGIALTFVLGTTSLINGVMQNAANSGFIPSHDLRMNPSDKLLKDQFNKNLSKAKKIDKKATLQKLAELKKAGNKEAIKSFKPINNAQKTFMDAYTPDEIQMIKIIDTPKTIKKKYLEKYIEVNKASRKEVFKTLIEAKPEDVNCQRLTNGTLVVGEKSFNVKDIPNMTKKSVEKFVKIFNVHNEKANVNVNDFKAVNQYVDDTFKRVGANFKNFNKIVNPIFGIPVAIAACYVLNAIYPPFRDKVAEPLMELFNVKSDKKKATSVEGGNK